MIVGVVVGGGVVGEGEGEVGGKGEGMVGRGLVVGCIGSLVWRKVVEEDCPVNGSDSCIRCGEKSILEAYKRVHVHMDYNLLRMVVGLSFLFLDPFRLVGRHVASVAASFLL